LKKKNTKNLKYEYKTKNKKVKNKKLSKRKTNEKQKQANSKFQIKK
jgi:hypothetical protein